ncbi:restriction endonuclease subunit S [Moraxella osloensis]|nr:restriction endonuclease subunit S [Moraxella osloensis]
MANYKKKAANAVLLADKMRKSVLQAAIEGKLTTQNPAEDGDARDLLVEIQAEKQRLISAGEIKREKALPAVDENYLPFDIPNNWVWVKIGDIFNIVRGGSPRPIQQFLTTANDGLNWIKIGDTDIGGKYITSTREKIKPAGLVKTRLVKKGSLLLTNSMSYGRPYILEVDGCIHDGWLSLTPLSSNLSKEFFYYLLSSTFVKTEFDKSVSGAVVKNLNSDKVRDTLIPLPPLKAQQRIVEKLEEILPQLDRLQADENKLHAIQTAFPRRMQASLLQAAIEGKLTTQDPKADGTASDLLKQIQAEKQRLIDAKEIKREKPLPAITDEEKPFDIPDNWEWVRLSQIGEIISGGTPKTTNLKYWQNGDIPWITPADMKNVSKYISKGARNITKAGLTSSSARLMPKGSVLFSSRAPIGYVAIAENEISTNQGFKSIVPFNFNLSEYLYFALMALANDIAKLGTGTTFKEVSGATVSNILIPLPPLAEQERIVAKLDALLPKVQALNDL